MTPPLVSVIIPTFNREDLIGETIESVLQQTHRAIEVIVVDDGSTDGTEKLVRSISQVRYEKQANAGQGAARNKGIKEAKGEFIAFLDSDDLWLPNKLERQLKVAAEFGKECLVYSDAEYFDSASGRGLYLSSSRIPPSEDAIDLFKRCYICSPTPLVHRSVFAKVRDFNDSPLLRCREDWEMWLRIAARYPLKYIPEVLARYRVHLKNATRSENLELLAQSCMEVINEACRHAPDVYGPHRQEAEFEHYLRMGTAYLSSNRKSEARSMYGRAIGLRKANIRAYRNWLASFAGAKALKLFRRSRGIPD